MLKVLKGKEMFIFGSLAEIENMKVLININTPYVFRNYAILVKGITVALGWLSMCRHSLCQVCDVFLLYEIC